MIKLDKNFIKRHKRVIKEIEIRKFFRLLGLKWLIVILITTISEFELYLGIIVCSIIIYDFYITIKKKEILFKKIIDVVIISILNIILFIICQNNEIKLLFLIFSIIVEFIVMLRELELYNKVKNL